MARIGYARVSSTDQNLALQIEHLKAAGCEIVRSEKVTGSTRQGRSELASIIAFLRPGDERFCQGSRHGLWPTRAGLAMSRL